MQNSYFSVISRFPHKTVHPLRNFLAVLPPLCKVQNSDSNIICGVRGGIGYTETRPLKNVDPEKCNN